MIPEMAAVLCPKVFVQNLSGSLDITLKSEKDQKMFAKVKSHDCSSIVENEFVEY